MADYRYVREKLGQALVKVIAGDGTLAERVQAAGMEITWAASLTATDFPEASKEDFETLKGLASGGAPISDEHALRLIDVAFTLHGQLWYHAGLEASLSK
jgi:hypothetical protein